MSILPPAAQGLPPLQWYQAFSKQPWVVHNPTQETAVACLDRLWHEWTASSKGRACFLRKRGCSRLPTARGVWLCGPVGCGKSLLMKAFFDSLPKQRKARVHFHLFMQTVHEALENLRGRSDPLWHVARQWVRKAGILCIDEFHVHDIADAMILSRLLDAFFDERLILVVTSNYAPDQLYLQGLQRDRFLPTIARLKQKLLVVPLTADQDYRQLPSEKEALYLYPLNPENHAKLVDFFSKAAQKKGLPSYINLAERSVPVIAHAEGVIWFDFSVLCGTARAQHDYLVLANRYHTVMVSNIPQLSKETSDAARRFTWLVDVFYEYHVRLMITAAVPAQSLYCDGPYADEFCRTASRLAEMASTVYLAIPHQSQQAGMLG